MFFLSSLFSLTLFYEGNMLKGTMNMISENFECGFYGTWIDRIKYRLNYWLIAFHFLIFELELLLVILIIFSYGSIIDSVLVWILLVVLSIELLL